MGFENMEVWKRSARLSAELYKELSGLKDYSFKDQITRSGLSIPSHIAEGEERRTSKESINFLNYAKGSCGELKTQILIGIDTRYIGKTLGKEWLRETDKISSMLGGLIRSKSKQATGDVKPEICSAERET